MSSFGNRVDGLEGRRKSVREQVVLAGSAVGVGLSRPVVVTDVSSKGAKLIGRNLPSRASNVLLTVGAAELFATVAWSARDECGVTFDEPLTAAQSEHVKLEGQWAKVMGVGN